MSLCDHVNQVKGKIYPNRQKKFYLQMKKLEKLIDITRPTELPKLSNQKSTSLLKGNVMIGKRWGFGKNLRTISAKPKESVKHIEQQQKVLPKVAEVETHDQKVEKIVTETDIPRAKLDTEVDTIKKKVETDTSFSKKESESIKFENSDVEMKSHESDHLKQESRIKGPTLGPLSDNQNTDENTLENHETLDEDMPKIKPKKRRPKKHNKTEDDKDTYEDNTDDNVKVPGDYDISDPKYATWLPPSGQTGDGRTSLNDKYGY